MGKQISLREAYEKVKKDSGNAPDNRLTALEKSIADYGSGWKTKEDARSLNSQLQFAKMRAVAQNNNELLKKINNITKSVTAQSDLYAKYNNADEYDADVKKLGYSEKYKNYTYQQISDFLSSDSYNVQRRRGLIDEAEAKWLKDRKYALATSADIENEITALGGRDKWENQKNAAQSEMVMSEGEKRKKIKSGTYTATQEQNRTQREEADKNLSEIGVLETILAQKKQKEAFDKKWGTKFNKFKQGKTSPSAEQTKIFEGAVKLVEEDEYFEYLTKEEKDFAASLTTGESANEALEYYKDLIGLRLDAQYNQELMQDVYDFSSQNALTGILGSLASIPLSLASGVEYAGSLLSGQTDKRTRTSTLSQGFREGTKSQIDSDFWDFVYDTTMSGVDSLAAAGISTAVPFAGEILLGASAASATYNDALNRGVTGGDAVLSSLTAGVAESLFEHISIGQLPALKAGNFAGLGFTKAGIKKAATEISKQMLVNATEETLTEVANVVADQLINGDLSSYAVAIEQYYMQGMSPEQAKQKAAEDVGKQVLLAGASGLLMGFGFGAGGSVVGLSSSQIKNSKNGSNIISSGNVNSLKTLAADSGIENIVKDAEKLTEKSKPSEVGSVFNCLYEKNVEAAIKQMEPILLENGATKGGSNSAKGWALQIARSIFDNTKNSESRKTALITNKVTSDVYTEFAKEGKYGGDSLLALKEIATTPYYGREAPADISQDITASPAADNAEVAAQGSEGPVTEAFRKSVDENLENERPTPQRPTKKKISKVEEIRVKKIAEAMGIEVEFTDELFAVVDDERKYADGKTENHKKVTISRYTVDPMKEVIKHEFTHTTEISKHYGKFQKYLFEESEAFKTWLEGKGYTKWFEMETDILKQYGKSYGHERAKSEIVAKFVSENFFKEKNTEDSENTEITEKFLKELYLKDRNLFERFVDWVKSVYARLKTSGAFNKEIIKLEQRFIRLAETAKKQRIKDEGKSSDNTSGETQYLFVGPKSLTADKLQLATAKDWLKKGIDSETIRKETGWFKGYDGKWRFEIRDKDFDIDKESEFVRYLNIITKSEKTKEEAKEFFSLSMKYFDDYFNSKITLDKLIKHDLLFKAYPELKNCKLAFTPEKIGYNGGYTPKSKTITLPTNRLGDLKELKSTLIHEIQHAVQEIEGFTKGASGVYWEERKYNGEVFLDKDGNEISSWDLYLRTAGEIEARDAASRIDKTDKERKNTRPDIDRKDVIFADKELVSASENVQYSIPSDHNYVYTDGKASFTEERLNNLFDEHSLGDGKRAEHSNAYVAYISPENFVNLTANKNIRGRVEDEAYILNEKELRNETETPFIEYDPVSGEVVNHEGRHRMVALKADGITKVAVLLKPSTDSFERRTVQDISLTGQNFAEGRAVGKVTVKTAVPLSEKYRTEAVAQFAQNPDADVRYSIPDVGIKQQLKDNLEKLNSMETVATLNEQKVFTSKQDVAEWALSKFEKIGFKVYRDIFGEIILDKKRITKGLRYLKTNEERLALALLPDVLSKGIEIGSHPNHKNRTYDTFTFAAPIMINGQRGNMAVVVRQEDNNYYKVHRLLMPDGSQFILDEKRDTAERAGGVDNNSGLSPTDNVSKISISDSNEKVKYSIPDIARGKTAPELLKMANNGEITSDDALKVLAEQYGTMPKGENPKVDVTLPEQISKSKNVNQFMRNVLESGHLDADMTETEKQNIISGARTYKPISDKAALDRAQGKIKTDVDGAVQEWENLIGSGKFLSKFDVALGEQLLVQAADTGNANDVTRYIAELADIGTQSGQVSQALRLLKQMTGIGQLYYVTRTVARLNKDIEARYGEKHKIIEIDPNLAKILASSKSEAEIDAVVEDLIKDVASQVKSSWVDKFNSWRYLAMLGNPRTHDRNIVGNTVFLPAFGTKNKIAALAEKFFVKQENRTKTFWFLKPEYRDFATADYAKMEKIIKSGGKMNPADQIRDQMKVFTSKAFAWLEKARRFNFDMLEKEDGWFLKGHYIRALGGAMQARGLDVKNVTPAQLEELRTYAIKEAQKATFRDVSHFAQTLNKLAHPGKDASVISKMAGVAVEGLLPFKKTPINILKRGIEYSPVGVATSIVEAIYSARKGNFSGAQLIDGLSAGLTGTGIMLLGALFWSLGFITGGMDYEDEDALERMAGKQPYAIKIGDYTYTIDFAAPAVLPFMIGAETAKIFSGEGNEEALGFFDAVAAIGAPMTELSMLQGLNDAIETIAYSDNKIGDFATNIFASYFSQYVPTLGGQIARTFDSTRRTNFVDKNSPFPKIIQTTYQKALGKIPGAENTKVPYIDAWGRTEENENFLLRAFENFISPGYISKVTDDDVNKALAQIYVDTGESGVIPKRAKTSFEVDGETVNLNADEYVQYATDKGQYSRQYLEEVMLNSMYQGLPSEGKAAVIANLYSFANAKAKSNVSDYDYTTVSTYKTVAKLEAAGISPASYYIAREAMSVENADTDGSGSVSRSEKKKALREAGFGSRDINTILNINKK